MCGSIWWWWIAFAGRLTYKQLTAIFPEKTIARKPHQCGFPTHLGRNQTQMAESAIRNATTTPIPLVLDNFWSFGHCGVSHYCHLCNWAQEKSPIVISCTFLYPVIVLPCNIFWQATTEHVEMSKFSAYMKKTSQIPLLATHFS